MTNLNTFTYEFVPRTYIPDHVRVVHDHNDLREMRGWFWGYYNISLNDLALVECVDKTFIVKIKYFNAALYDKIKMSEKTQIILRQNTGKVFLYQASKDDLLIDMKINTEYVSSAGMPVSTCLEYEFIPAVYTEPDGESSEIVFLANDADHLPILSYLREKPYFIACTKKNKKVASFGFKLGVYIGTYGGCDAFTMVSTASAHLELENSSRAEYRIPPELVKSLTETIVKLNVDKRNEDKKDEDLEKIPEYKFMTLLSQNAPVPNDRLANIVINENQMLFDRKIIAARVIVGFLYVIIDTDKRADCLLFEKRVQESWGKRVICVVNEENSFRTLELEYVKS